MTNPWTDTAASPTPSKWTRARGIFATLAVAGIIGTAVIAPMTTSTDAAADELASPEELHERITQEFVAADAPEDNFIFETSATEQKPKPKPKPKKDEADEESTDDDAAAEESAEAGAAGLPMYEGGGNPEKWMTAAGISESDFAYVDYIASRESGWNPNATNASSGACGLIQANPCSKVPGNGYDPVDNLKWATGYAEGRYGSWKGAYEFWSSNHWW